MATTNYAYSDVKVLKFGQFTAFADLGGKPANRLAGLGASVHLRVEGETFTFAYLTITDESVQYRINGGSWNVCTLNTDSAWHTFSIAGGTDGVYRNIEIKVNNPPNFYLSAASDAFTSTSAGSTPGALATYTGTDVPVTGTHYILDDATYADYIKQEGNFEELSSDGYTTAGSLLKLCRGNCGVLRFAVSAGTTQLWLWGIRNGNATRVLIDNAIQTQVVWENLASTEYYGWTKVADLDGLAHDIEITWSFAQANLAFVWSLQAVGGTIATDTLTDRDAWAFFGNSITQVTSDTTRTAQLGHPWLLARQNGFQCISRGASNELLADADARAGQVTSATPTPEIIVVVHGTVDAVVYGNTPTGGQLTAFASDYDTMLAAIGHASKVLHCGVPNLTGINTVQYSDLIEASVTTAANANIKFCDLEGVIDPVTDTYDGVHPTAADGYPKIVDAIQARLEELGWAEPIGGLTPDLATIATTDIKMRLLGLI